MSGYKATRETIGNMRKASNAIHSLNYPPNRKRDLGIQIESGRKLGLELAFNHGIDLGRGRGIGLRPCLFPRPYATLRRSGKPSCAPVSSWRGRYVAAGDGGIRLSEFSRLLDMDEMAAVGEADQPRIRDKVVQDIGPARAADEIIGPDEDERRFR